MKLNAFDSFDLIPSSSCPMGLHPRHHKKLTGILKALWRQRRYPVISINPYTVIEVKPSAQQRRKWKKWLNVLGKARIRAITTTRDVVAADLYVASWQKANGMTVLEEIQKHLEDAKLSP